MDFEALDPSALRPVTQLDTTDEASAARSFEALLLERLLRPATQPAFGPSPLDGGSAGRLYREMFVSEVARLAAERGGLGLGASLGERLHGGGR